MTPASKNELIPDSIQPGAGPGIRELFGVIWKNLWLILLAVIVAGVLGWAWARAQSPVYEANAKLVIETQGQNILSDVAPVVDTGGQSYWAIREYLETQIRILASSAVAGEVAVRLGLDQDPAFLGLDGLEDPALIEQNLALINPAALVQSRVSIEPVENSRVVNIRARAGEPQLAAALANMTAEVYMERNLERRLESTNAAAQWLADQYSSLSATLRDSERALVDFRQDHGLLAVELSQHVSLMSRMEETSRQLAQARLEADRARAIVRQIDNAMRGGDLLSLDLTAIVENTLIQALKAELYELESERATLSARYLEEHPQMIALAEREDLARERLSREISNVVGAYRQQAARAEQLVGVLESRLSSAESDVQALGTHQVEYAALQRDVEANRQMFELIERRLKEVEITRNSQQNNVELLESAFVPVFPIAPRRQIMVLAALALGLLVGLFLAFLREALDSSIRGQRVIERDFGLVVLGMIPRIRRRWGATRSADTASLDDPRSVVAESCRAIRTSINFLLAEKPGSSLVVTSPGPREGKTTVCANIASVMALSGSRILLIDADMRRPRVHSIFGLSNDSGLSSVLNGAPASGAIQSTQVANLDVLTSGPLPENPAELLASEAFSEMLQELGQHYDRILVDSPPIVPVTDAAVLAGRLGGVVVVVRNAATHREMLRRSVETLAGVQANLLGVILNDVDLSRGRGDGYTYYRQMSRYYGTPGSR